MPDNKIDRAAVEQYSGVAIGLHWLIAVLIIGMLAVGKWMTALDLEDPLRFNLTQWHKSIGITLLLLSVFRLYWRKTHHPPISTEPAPAWEKMAASVTHRLFYVLLLILPLSGWLLVSASPLNIPTVLFQTIPWPHIPVPDIIENSKEVLSGWFLTIHHLTANLMLLLLLLHIAAALRHHFILKDNTLLRMSPLTSTGKLASGLIPLLLLVIVFCSAVLALNKLPSRSLPVAITDGEVRFTATLMGAELQGSFQQAEIEVKLNPAQPEGGVLNAVVHTGSLYSGDTQVDSTLLEKDWFDSKNFPLARFQSSAMEKNSDDSITVAGILTIKEISREIDFPVSIQTRNGKPLLRGGFTLNRLDYKVGAVDQPDDSYAGYNVLIEFAFNLE